MNESLIEELSSLSEEASSAMSSIAIREFAKSADKLIQQIPKAAGIDPIEVEEFGMLQGLFSTTVKECNKELSQLGILEYVEKH